MRLKCNEVRCENCGKAFQQARSWQVYCCKACKDAHTRADVSSLRALRLRLRQAEQERDEALEEVERLCQAQKMGVAHSGGYRGPSAPSPKPFRYDDEDQSQGWTD